MIEVVLALGVVSFALVAIMGLFPMALKSAQESQRQTRATQIAQQIFTDLRAFPPANTLIATNTNIASAQIRFSLTNSTTRQVSYTYDGVPMGGGNVSGAVFSAEIKVAPNIPSQNLTTISALIETPPGGAYRSKYYFSTVLSQK